MLNKTPPTFGQRGPGARPQVVRQGAAPRVCAPATVNQPQSEPSGAESRWAKRSPSRLGAQILHPNLVSPILCTIRDTSSTGARLEVAVTRGGTISRDSVPERFTLFMPSDRLEVDCEVAWRQGLVFGVRYVSPTRRTQKQTVIKRPENQPKKPHTSLVKLLINPI